MEIQIQDLVSSIRKEGLDAANAQAQSIIADAEKKAAQIIAEAKAEADSVMKAAEKEIGIRKESAAISAQQAKRDAMLAFKIEVQTELEKILAGAVKKELKEESIGKLICAALAGEDVSKYTVEISDVKEYLKQNLAEEIKNGLEIRPTKGVQTGFRISAKDGSGYFDCSDEEIMKMLMPYFRNLDF